MAKHAIHSDFKWLRFAPNFANEPRLRLYNRIYRLLFRLTSVPKGIKASDHTIKGYGGRAMQVLTFRPKDLSPGAPCLVYFHGGGLFAEALPLQKQLACRYAQEAECVVVFPQYAVSVDAPFPAGLEDCYAALVWAKDHASTLGIAPDRIAVGGDSAGGSMAACVSQLALDRKSVVPCFQLLVYPVCDHRMSTASMSAFTDTPVWNTANTHLMWKLYLNGHENAPPYTSAQQRADLSGLPNAYIETAEFDPLRDEGNNYAGRLKEAGVTVELNETKGTVHGYDAIASSGITKANVQRRIQALRRAFGGGSVGVEQAVRTGVPPSPSYRTPSDAIATPQRAK